MRILMMIHRLADNSPYCFYVHEQAKALREQGHDLTVISCVGTMPILKRLRPALAQTDKRTPKADVIDGIPVYFPRCLTLGNAGEKLLGGYPMYRAALPIARKLHDEKPFDVIHAHMLPREGHAGRLLGRALGVPVALTVHGTDSYLKFFWFDSTGGALLYPNTYEANNLLKAGQEYKIPFSNAVDYLMEKQPGKDNEKINIMMVATKENIPFTEVVTYQKVLKWVYSIPVNQRCAFYEMVLIK